MWRESSVSPLERNLMLRGIYVRRPIFMLMQRGADVLLLDKTLMQKGADVLLLVWILMQKGLLQLLGVYVAMYPDIVRKQVNQPNMLLALLMLLARIPRTNLSLVEVMLVIITKLLLELIVFELMFLASMQMVHIILQVLTMRSFSSGRMATRTTRTGPGCL